VHEGVGGIGYRITRAVPAVQGFAAGVDAEGERGPSRLGRGGAEVPVKGGLFVDGAVVELDD
jgi:hypothetical protein